MAGEADGERLVVLLEARIRDFEKNMQKASGTADRSYGRLRKDSRSATRQMEADMVRSTTRINQALASTSTRIGAFGKASLVGLTAGAAAALAPILSVVGALNGAKAALTEFDRIGKAAKASGLDAEFFQGLEHSATLGGVGVDQLSQALAAFNRNAGMAAIGKGELVEKLKQLHPELLKNIMAARSQEERLRLVADALDKETDASRKAAIAAAAFGDAGVRMVEMLKGGSAALDDTARKARDLGLVVDRDLIARAEELNDEFSTATRIMDLQFKQALVNLAPILVGIAERAGRLAGDIRYLIDQMKELEDRSSDTLKADVVDVDRERLDIENQILDIRQQQRDLTGATAVMESRILEGTVKALEERLAALSEKGASIETILGDRRDSRPPLAPIDPGSTIPELPDSGRGSSRNSAAGAAIREAEAVKQLIAELQFEQAQLNQTDLQKKTNETLRRAGAAATDDERKQIEQLVEAIHLETEELKRNKQAQEARTEAISNLFQMGSDALQSIADGSVKAEDALKKLVVQLALAAAQAALLGTGPLAGAGGILGGLGGGGGGFLGNLFKSIFGKGFATGTANTGGARGEPRGIVHGQEAVIPLPDGRRVPVEMRGVGASRPQRVEVFVSSNDEKLRVFVRQEADGSIKEAAPRIVGAAVNQANANVVPTMGKYQRDRAGGDYRG